MTDLLIRPETALRVLSVEDEPEAVAGPLDSLDLEGHLISSAEDLDTARDLLANEVFDLLILDQRLGEDESLLEAGSTLAAELKSGTLGALNVDVPFLFVTGSDAWVDENEMKKLRGYRGILLKGDALTPQLKQECSKVTRRRSPATVDAEPTADVVAGEPADLRDRVLLRIVDRSPEVVRVLIPSWDLEETVTVSCADLPAGLRNRADITGQRLFGWMDLRTADAPSVRLRDLEVAPEPTEDDDGLP